MQTNIQLLRFIAAMAVFLYHASPHFDIANGASDLTLLTRFIHIGYAGVDVFFVISGYIMVVSTQTYAGAAAVGQFIYRRATRIYLGYWPYFLMMLAMTAWYTPARVAAVDLPGSFFLTQILPSRLILPVSWSLKFELYFYLCFAITLFLPKRTRVFLIILAFILTTTCMLLSALVDATILKQYAHWMVRESRFWLSPFCTEFLSGCLLAMIIQRHDTARHLTGWCLAFAGACLFTAFWHMEPLMHSTLQQNINMRVAVLWPLAFTLVGLAAALENNGWVAFKRAAVFLGGASYSLYLSHTIFLEWFGHSGLRTVFEQWTPDMPFIKTITLLLLATLILFYSVWHYQFIESPLYRAARRLSGKKTH